MKNNFKHQKINEHNEFIFKRLKYKEETQKMGNLNG